MKFIHFLKKFTSHDDQIAAQIKAATQITMDDAARAKTRALLSEYVKTRPVRVDARAASVEPNSRRVSQFFMRHSMPAFAAVLVLAVSGGTAAAAEGALPGDILYPVKVHVTEELRARLATSPKAEADWAVNRAARRLEEAATLALTGKLNDEKRAEIDTNLDAHVKTAGASRQKLENENELKDASEIEMNIGAIALARENILDGGRARMRAANASGRAQAAPGTATAISARAELQEARHNGARDGANGFETITKGQRTAAKARIEATKKFLEHSADRLPADAREQAKARLEAAKDAFSSGDDDTARGNKEEASSNFNAALETATEIETLISTSND